MTPALERALARYSKSGWLTTSSYPRLVSLAHESHQTLPLSWIPALLDLAAECLSDPSLRLVQCVRRPTFDTLTD